MTIPELTQWLHAMGAVASDCEMFLRAADNGGLCLKVMWRRPRDGALVGQSFVLSREAIHLSHDCVAFRAMLNKCRKEILETTS